MRLLPFVVFLWLSVGENQALPQNKKPAAKPAPIQSSARRTAVDEFAGKARYALVIGNSNYQRKPLPNPVKDAAIISRSLRAVNFKVTEKNDLTLAQMRQALDAFSSQIPQNAVGLFFFAGHGVQVSGKNFLLPVDYGTLDKSEDLLNAGLDLDGIIAALSKKSGLSLVILDACRDNAAELALSFKVEQGFAPIKQTAAGIYIAYSTAPGTQANDGIGGNSPYSKALAQNLTLNPGRLEDVFMKTRIDVINETADYPGGQQTPWENGSLSTVFYLTPDKLQPTLQTSIAKQVLLKPELPANVKSLLQFSFGVPILNKRGSRTNLKNAVAAFFAENIGSGNLEMVEIAGGNFQMGSSATDAETAFADALRSNDKTDRDVITAEMPSHLVAVPRFYMSKYEITQKQWRAVMKSVPDIPGEFRGDDLPIINVTWQQAKAFCDRLTGITNRNYRLPTEAEWEYAARAGTETPFAFGENINSNYVNFFGTVPFGSGDKGEFRQTLVPVGSLNGANAFGLHDMHGNVWEWCEDAWHSDYNSAPTDGSAWEEPEKGAEIYRIIRGGSFESIGNNCRSAHRRAKPAVEGFATTDIGFRVVTN